MIKTMLRRLYYDVDLTITKHPSEDLNFHRALLEFETRAELKPDGLFSSREMERLRYFSTLANYADLNVTPLAFKSIGSSDGYLWAKGTWVMQGEALAFPNNAADIDCWRSFDNCIVADANISTPSATDSFGPSSNLSVATSYWDIASWSETRVVAEQVSVCRRSVLTVDVTAKHAYQGI